SAGSSPRSRRAMVRFFRGFCKGADRSDRAVASCSWPVLASRPRADGSTGPRTGDQQGSSMLADPTNPGPDSNRNDTEKQAQKGGQQSSGSFGEANAADPSQAGRKGGQSS